MPRFDGILYKILKNLSLKSLDTLTDIYSRILIATDIPITWIKYLIKPLLKNGKDFNKGTSYRPITLQSCLSKVVERLVLKRIVSYIEGSNTLPPNIIDFFKKKSTQHGLKTLSLTIQNGFSNKKVIYATFWTLMQHTTESQSQNVSNYYNSLNYPTIIL